MKRINRKGFTLVELLVVLVILVVIMSIAIPSVTSSIERSKQKQKDSKIEILVSAAEIFVDRHKNSYNDASVEYTISVKELICDNLISKEQAKNPFNDRYTLGGYVKYSKSSNSYTWVENNSSIYVLEISATLTCS